MYNDVLYIISITITITITASLIMFILSVFFLSCSQATSPTYYCLLIVLSSGSFDVSMFCSSNGYDLDDIYYFLFQLILLLH